MGFKIDTDLQKKAVVLTATGATEVFRSEHYEIKIVDYGVAIGLANHSQVLFPWARVLEYWESNIGG